MKIIFRLEDGSLIRVSRVSFNLFSIDWYKNGKFKEGVFAEQFTNGNKYWYEDGEFDYSKSISRFVKH